MQGVGPWRSQGSGMANNKEVLVVDDNVDAAESLMMLLEIHGFETRMANSGPAALAAVAEKVPTTVILDISMPGMDGYEVARRLREHYPSERLQLLGLSGYGDAESSRKAEQAGFDRLLLKPISVDTIVAQLR